MGVPVEPPLRRAPGSRPSLRASSGVALPGSPRVNPFGAEDYARAPETHGVARRHGAHDPHGACAAGHAPGESLYANPTGPERAARARPVQAFVWRRDVLRPGWSVLTDPKVTLRPVVAAPERARPTPTAPPAATPPPIARAEVPRRSLWSRIRPTRALRDPAPSRLAYRLNRLWLTPSVRRFGKVGLPVALIAFSIGLVAVDPARRDLAAGMIEDVRNTFYDRPEFRVEALAVSDVSPELRAAVESRIDVGFPESSFRIDLDALRAAVLAVDAVQDAELRITADRTLDIRVTERAPAIVWRGPGGLALLDADGHRIARLGARHARADLPLIAGEGADKHVAEALALLGILAPVHDRVRGLVRVGARRWDVVLDRDQRVQLPETGPLDAMEHIMALDRAHDLLARDVVVVDLRNTARPVLRLSEGALETLHSIRQLPE